jgi:hypothetical protein
MKQQTLLEQQFELKNIIVFLFVVFIAACTKKQPECNTEQVKLMLQTAYKKDLQKYLAGKSDFITKTYEKVFPIYTDSVVASFLRNGHLKIENISTVEKKQDRNACGCKAMLTYRVSDAFLNNYKNRAASLTDQEYLVNPEFLRTDVDAEIEYTVQITGGKEKISLASNATEDLRYSLGQFIFLYALNKMVALKLNTAE